MSLYHVPDISVTIVKGHGVVLHIRNNKGEIRNKRGEIRNKKGEPLLTLLSFTCFICALFRYCSYYYYTIEFVVLIGLGIAAYTLSFDTRRSYAATLYQNISHAVGSAYGKHKVGFCFSSILVGITVQTDAGRRVLIEIFYYVRKHDVLLG